MSNLTAASLDDGAWTLTESRRACAVSRRLHDEAGALLLTYRAHRFRPIFGASDANGHHRQHRGLGAFASRRPVRIRVHPSRGSDCDMCGHQIFQGEMQFDAIAGGQELRLDATCYLILVDEVARLQPEG